MIYITYKIFKYALFICRNKDKKASGYVTGMPPYTKIKHIERYDCPVNIAETRKSMQIERIDKYLQQPDTLVESDRPDGKEIIDSDQPQSSKITNKKDNL